jgi:hypothetical protein
MAGLCARPRFACQRWLRNMCFSKQSGWADAFVIWDDDDIYLPWHLAAHAKVLQHAQWSNPKLVWSLFGGGPKLQPTGGVYWASAAARRDLHSLMQGFIPSARADFDQAHLSAWRRYGGEPGPAGAPLLRVRLGPGQAWLLGNDEPGRHKLVQPIPNDRVGPG